jgi:hypothetical protein
MVKESKRCTQDVLDPKTKKTRPCKNKKVDKTEYCSCHGEVDMKAIQVKKKGNGFVFDLYINKCCFCNEEIKMESQACGSCARNMSMRGFNY